MITIYELCYIVLTATIIFLLKEYSLGPGCYTKLPVISGGFLTEWVWG